MMARALCSATSQGRRLERTMEIKAGRVQDLISFTVAKGGRRAD